MREMESALERTRAVPAQTKVEVVRGVLLRRTENGIPVITVHYSADPERDPEINPEWKKAARKKYSSQGAWDREQECQDEAGGGELVFAEALRTYWDKIVITDPRWRPEPEWRCIGGFDHGKTNPTALVRFYIDYSGNIYACGEYYQPGKHVWEHAPAIKGMPDYRKLEVVYADPTIFDKTQQDSSRKEARAINDLYLDEGVDIMTPYTGTRSDITFAERVMQHWADLDTREPSFKIVCRNASEKPQPGLHGWDCPNLLWELLRTRRKKFTAQQMMTQNASEEIVDKENHARDGCKYALMTLPEPTRKTAQQRVAERLSKFTDLTSANAFRHKIEQEEYDAEGDDPIPLLNNPRSIAQIRGRRRF